MCENLFIFFLFQNGSRFLSLFLGKGRQAMCTAYRGMKKTTVYKFKDTHNKYWAEGNSNFDVSVYIKRNVTEWRFMLVFWCVKSSFNVFSRGGELITVILTLITNQFKLLSVSLRCFKIFYSSKVCSS